MMMRRTLCLGDSLTAGSLGISWLEELKRRPSAAAFELINAGENGFTLEGLAGRLERELETGSAPEILILEGGANDLLLPHMQAAGRAWDPFIRRLQRHGSPPAPSAEAFAGILTAILQRARAAGVERIICSTIPCLGEDLGSPLNKDRELYNRIIREGAAAQNAETADPALIFEEILGDKGSPYLFAAPADLERDALLLAADEQGLCGSRGIRLTVDGAHLNSRGAELFAEELERTLTGNRLPSRNT